MIIAIYIVAYIATGLAVSRWTYIRRIRMGIASDYSVDDVDYVACGLAFAFWPIAALMYTVTRPPKPPKPTKQEEIDKLERELGIQ